MPLDSDINNPDSQLHVEFYLSTEKQYAGRPFVRIQNPGDKTLVIDTPVREDHKDRFARQWLFFQMQNNDAPIVGIPLMEWHQERPDEVSANQIAELSILKFQTVDQLATATDMQIQRIGMGGDGLRNLARNYMKGKNASEKSKELDEANAKIEALQAQMAEIMEQMQRSKGGRPRKEAEAA